MKGNSGFWLIAAALLLVLAVVLLMFFPGWLNSGTVPVILPETTASLPVGSAGSAEGISVAAVTVETVQAVLGTLTRPDAYSRVLTVERFWSGGSSTDTVSVWQKGSMTRIDLSGKNRQDKHILCNGEKVSIWYGENTAQVYTCSRGSSALTDTLQMLPTYEDVLELEPAAISAAGYVQQDGAWRIMVAAQPEGEYLTVYYLSIETGLLEYAERWDGETLVYRMTAGTADLAAPQDGLFRIGGEPT